VQPCRAANHLFIELVDIGPVVLFFRSFIFNIAWYVNLIVQMLVQTPIYFFLPHHKALGIPRRWAQSNTWLHRYLTGTEIEITGHENIPEGGCIVASKHQSVWEFYGLYAQFRDPCFVLKSELMKIPLFGWYLAKVKQLPIRRGDKGKAMRKMIREAKLAVDGDRQILIFPEGTRKAPDAETDYRYGVTRMYLDLNCPVVPVALTSGLFWPRRKFVRYPGVLRMKILEPIMPGLTSEQFSAELERRIEEGCDELYLKTSQDAVQPPLTEKILARAALAKARLGL